MTDLGQRIFAAALAWHEAGASVVPCSEKGGKRPGLDWKPLVVNRLSKPALRGFFSMGSRDGFGILLGYGDFEMFEVEGRAVLDGTVGEFFELMRNNAPELLAKLSAGYVEHTPTGGVHWIYRVAGEPARNKKLAANEKGECLIETRGEGGFVVLAPSGGRTHTEIPNGEWRTSRTPADVVTISVEEREKLYAVAEMVSRNVRVDAGPGPSGERRELVARGEGSPVDDYNANGDWSILVEHGWRIASTDDRGTTYWIRPGKDDLSENVHSASTREDSPNLYIWSTSVKGLAAEVPHSRAFIRAHYKHGGNMGACREELAGRGFGRPVGERVDDWAAADKLAWAEERALLAEQARAALANAFATQEQIENAEAVLAAAVEAIKGQRFYDVSELDEIDPPEPLIVGLLDVGCTAVLAGMHSTYKSFCAIGWACALATGKPWGTHTVPKSGKVLYVAAEGASGLNKRVKAWMVANGPIEKGQLTVFPRPVKVMDEEALHEIEQFVHENDIDLLVLDTMRRMTPGVDENSSTEMSTAMAQVDGIRERQGCTVLWVHHTGYKGGGTRGSSSVEDDSDIVWLIELEDGDSRQPDNRRILKQKKAKDGELAEDRPLIFKVEQVHTRRGSESSGYVEPSESPFERSKPGLKGEKKIEIDMRIARDILELVSKAPGLTTTELTRTDYRISGSEPKRKVALNHLERTGLLVRREEKSGRGTVRNTWTFARLDEIKDRAPDLEDVHQAFKTGQELSVEQVAKFLVERQLPRQQS